MWTALDQRPRHQRRRATGRGHLPAGRTEATAGPGYPYRHAGLLFGISSGDFDISSANNDWFDRVGGARCGYDRRCGARPGSGAPADLGTPASAGAFRGIAAARALMGGLQFDTERDAVRVVLTDDGGRVLLFHAITQDVGPAGWWELPGGGIDDGESYLDAAVREVNEETGLVLDPAAVGPPSWRRDSTWRSRGQRRLQHEVVVGARVRGHRPAIRADGRTAYELEVYVDARWWEVADILGSAQRFYPGRLPELLPAFLAGEAIDEPFEFWN
jgi:8-oxo-dGTP pyrophosphatase MutT (NUDIX family)